MFTDADVLQFVDYFLGSFLLGYVCGLVVTALKKVLDHI